MDILAIIQLTLGVIFTFTGLAVFRTVPPAGGFIIGGLIGINFAGMVVPPEMWTPLAPFIAFVAVGVVGAIIAVPLQLVMAVISGSALGALIGMIVGYVLNQHGVTSKLFAGATEFQSLTSTQIWIMLGLAVLFGILTLRFEDEMLILSTAYLGAMIATVSLPAIGALNFPVFRNPLLLMFILVFLGLFGVIVQFANRPSE
jgi:hypothetical protein